MFRSALMRYTTGAGCGEVSMKELRAVRVFLGGLLALAPLAGVNGCIRRQQPERTRSLDTSQALNAELLASVRAKDTAQGGKQKRAAPPEPRSSPTSARYLLFQIFTGGPHPNTGRFHISNSKSDYARIVGRIKQAIKPEYTRADCRLGFSVGPLTLDSPPEDTRRIIRDSFSIAADQDMALAFHIDDYMFWSNATDAAGNKLIA